MEGNKIPTNISPIVNQIIKEVQLIAPIYEHLSYQKSEKNFQDYPYEEENDFDLDEQKEQLENFKNSDEANSHSTDDAQESINSNKTSGQVSSPSTKPKIQLQGATKLVYQSDCGGDTKYMEEALTTHSGTAHSVNGAANILDINYKNDPLATNLSPAITYKKKEYQNQTSKKKDVDSKQAIEEEQSKFVIIRSSKSFVPEQTHNNNNNQNKKRKKKRSKAVGPSQTASKDEQSSKLNAFMRSIVSTVPEEQIVQKEISETQIYEPVVQTQQPAVIKKTESKKTVKTSQQPVYVKKAVHESLIPPVAKSEKIDDTNSKSFIQNSATKFSNFLKNEDSKQNQHNNNSQFQPKTHASQKLSSHDEFEEKSVNAHTKRFDHFINEKESFQYGGLRGGDNMGNSERPRKKDNKQQQHKKSANWGNPNNRNGKKNAQSPQDGLLKRNSYHSNNNTHVMKKDQSQSSNLSNQYLSTPVTRHHSVNEGQYDQGIGMNIDYNQQYDMYQQIDQSNIPFISIEQIQSLITNAAAMMQSQQQYIKQHAEAQMAFDNAENRIHNYNNMNQVDTQELEEMFFDKLEVQIKSLEKEIERKLDSVRKERQLAITTLEEIIKKTYNENSHQNSLNHKNFVGIRMYGSMASGLAIDSSDVDLAVTGLDFHGNRESHLKEMRELYHQLSFIKSKSSIKFVDSATVPVIKLIIDLQKIHEQTAKNGKKSLGASLKTSNESSLQSTHEIDPSMRYLGIDITFEDSQGSLNDQFGNFSQSLNGNIQPSKINLGIQCISHIQTLRMEFPDLKPIVMVLKRLLQLKDLNQPYHGGISSYSLVLMTSTFLNQCGTDQMGSNLSEFLNYYGNFFDPQNTQLDGKSFSTRFSGNTLDPMVVIDPLNPSNNTTRSSFRISEIQYVFKRAHNVIYQKLEEFKKSSENSQEFDVIRYIVDNQDNILM